MNQGKYTTYIIVTIVLILFISITFYIYKKDIFVNNEVAKSNLTQDYNNKIATLQKQVSGLQDQIANVNKQNAAAALVAKESAKSQNVTSQAKQQSITNVVSKIVPSVVSVLISKNIPQYQVQYQNPFGNDPTFQNFDIQVPVYVATGSSKTQEIGAGSGFLLSSNGYILTNKHVVSDDTASYTVLLSNGKQQDAKVIYKDTKNDIAIIKIDGNNYTPVNLGDSSSLQLGQTVIAVGNALGKYNNSISLGIISGLDRTLKASNDNGDIETLNGIIQIDAALNPGNSGGPLIDTNGNVVGVNVATAQGANNINFSIPINTIKSIIKQEVNI